MLSAADQYLREHNRDANPILYGQDHNDDSWAICKSDMLLKGENAENIILGDTFTRDGYTRRPDGRKHDVYYQDRIRVSQGNFMEATATRREIASFRLQPTLASSGLAQCFIRPSCSG